MIGEGKWCHLHDRSVPIVDEFDDVAGFEEQARPFHVVVLDCGHEIATPHDPR